MTKSRQSQPAENTASQITPPPAAGWVKVVTDNVRIIGLVLAAIIIIAALYSGYSYYKNRTLRNAQQTVDQIMSNQQGQARISALEDFLPQAPDEMQTALYLQLARLCLQEEDFDRADVHWEHIQENTQDRDMQVVAAMGRATALSGLDKPSEALALLHKTADQAPKRYQRTLNLKIAATAEQAGDWEQALQAYQDVADMAALGAQRDEFIEHKIRLLKKKMNTSRS